MIFVNATTFAKLAKLLEGHYAVGALKEAQQLTRGYVNVSYVLTMEAEGQLTKYFLRKYKQGTQEPEIRFEHSLIGHLLENNFHLVAGLIPTKQGGTYLKERGEAGATFYALFDYLSGEDRYTWDNPVCSDDELACSAVVLARFHQKAFDWVPQGKRVEPKIINLLPVIAKQASRRAEQVGDTPFDDYFLENLPMIQTAVKRTAHALQQKGDQDLVQCAIHCDYHPGNLKFTGREVTGLFDFDWSKIDFRCFDVALAMNYFCTPWGRDKDGQLDLRKAARFLGTYQDTLRGLGGIGAMGSAELDAFPAMIMASALYLAHWTLEDYYSAEADPEEYLVYLRHILRLMAWLEVGKNQQRLEEMIGEVGP
jgi:homoserine kinase type II